MRATLQMLRVKLRATINVIFANWVKMTPRKGVLNNFVISRVKTQKPKKNNQQRRKKYYKLLVSPVKISRRYYKIGDILFLLFFSRKFPNALHTKKLFFILYYFFILHQINHNKN